MVNVPLGVGAFSRTPAYQPEVVLKNFMVEKDVSGAGTDDYYRIQRPGLAVYQTTLSAIQVRGLFHMQGILSSLPVAVVGTNLIQMTGSAVVVLGTVANDETYVQFAPTNFGLGVLSAGTVYFYDTSLHTLTVPTGKTPVSLCSLNSYLIVGCADGTWYWAEPGTTTIDALHFATAESQPDNIVCMSTIRDEVFMFGTETTEVWQPTGDPDEIMIRAAGRTFDKGCMARDTVQPLDTSVLFVGSDGIVYRITDGNPERVSNIGIEERILARTGIPSACTFVHNGHAFYVLFIPGVGSYAYDQNTGQWAMFTSTSTDSHGWKGRVSCAMGTITLVGDGDSGKVFKLDPTINKDDGVVFERSVSGAVPFMGGRKRMDSLQVHVGCSAPCTVRVRVHDGLDSGYGAYRTATARAPTDLVRFTRFGAAKQPCRVVEISTMDDVQIRISSATVNEGRAI